MEARKQAGPVPIDLPKIINFESGTLSSS